MLKYHKSAYNKVNVTIERQLLPEIIDNRTTIRKMTSTEPEGKWPINNTILGIGGIWLNIWQLIMGNTTTTESRT